jgi:hypothetical protein
MDAEYLYFLFEVATIGLLIIGFIYLFVLSLIVRDYKLIVERPFIFTVELLFMMLLPAIPLLFFCVSRSVDLKTAIIYASTLAAKFGAFHVVLQLSGTYTHMFGA